MKKVSIVGVILGGITDIVSTVILGIPFTAYVLLKYLPHTSPGQEQTAMVAVIRGNAMLLTVQWILGMAGSILGGYVASWIAKHDELLNGALSSWLCILFGVVSLVMPRPAFPIYQEIIALVASPLFALLGGWLRLAQNRANAVPAKAAF
jgi:cell shape-determining protein MreD